MKTRRSRRKFLGKKVSDRLLKRIIECAARAPYSGAGLGCEFIVVRNCNTKKRLSEVRDGRNEEAIMTSSALVVVCSSIERPRWLENGVMAAANVLLAAHDAGLGAVYTTAFHPTKKHFMRRMRAILGLPPEIMPVCIIPVGFPDPCEKLEKKKLPGANKIVRFEKW